MRARPRSSGWSSARSSSSVTRSESDDLGPAEGEFFVRRPTCPGRGPAGLTLASTPEMIGTAVGGLLEEVPALRKLKLVFGLDIRAKGDVQTYRVELPGPEVSKGRGEDERCRVEIDRPTFNALADPKSGLSAYRRAVEDGHVRFEGDANVAKLVTKVVETHEQRSSLKKVH